MKKFSLFQLPIFIWAAFIFWLSSLSNLPQVETPIISADKLAHMSVFFVFCSFSRRALYFQNAFPILKKWSLICAFFLTCLYGYLDEVHQLYVPGRSYDYFDMLADAIGAILFVVLLTFFDRRKGKQAITS
jgi:VanZ family protein